MSLISILAAAIAAIVLLNLCEPDNYDDPDLPA
jgi:hypothetical protein